ncbi:MAG: ACP S-malonyltransferase [Firmicutes bacterium]|nr:ACP S-malonyltransferase [Bacillota bacterium]
MSIAFVFPGQGAQYLGMGRELALSSKLVMEYFERADAALGFSLSKLCWEGPSEDLTLTENAQPAILTMSCAAAALAREQHVHPAAAAGLSLGEYSALVTAGMLDFETAVKLVAKRGRYMQQAVPAGTGGMAAVFGLDDEAVLEICQRSGGVVEPANYNCPGQIVISGEQVAVAEAVELAKEKGARRAMALEVSAPFHSSMLQPAAEKLAADLAELEFSEPEFPVLSNVDARPVTVENVRELLAKQVASPVLWQQCVEKLAAMGITTLVEAGPGRVLSTLARKIDRSLKTKKLEVPEDLEQLREEF